MINLKNYIIKSILGVKSNIDNVDESIKEQIKKFLDNNLTNASNYIISDKPNKDGKYEVSSSKNIIVINKKITSLTNGFFIWTNIKGNFTCDNCKSLISLDGAPEEVGGDFYCNRCDSLTSLEGAPKVVGGDFNFVNCASLKSLKGAPEEVGRSFYGDRCTSLTSLEGAPKEVGRNFRCSGCESLTSLKGAPKEVGGDFDCSGCDIEFTIDDVKKVSNVKGKIFV